MSVSTFTSLPTIWRILIVSYNLGVCFSDDQMRKQAENLAGNLVVAGQEIPHILTEPMAACGDPVTFATEIMTELMPEKSK